MKQIFLKIILPLVLLFSITGCFLPDEKYDRLREDYTLVREEIVKHWDEYPPSVKRAFIRIDKILVAYDKSRGAVLKPMVTIIKNSEAIAKSLEEENNTTKK